VVRAQRDNLQKAIEDEQNTISELKDTIAGKSKEQNAIELESAELLEQITSLEADAIKAKKQRSKGEALYKKELEDYKGTIEAVKKALSAMEKAGQDTKVGFLQAQRQAKQALSFLGGLRLITAEQRAAIEEFTQRSASASAWNSWRGTSAALPNNFGAKPPPEHVYDFKSSNVVDLLKNLKDAFTAEKKAAIDAETNAQSAYELSSKARNAAIEAAKGSRSKKKVQLAEVKKTLVDAKSDLESEQADLDADSATLEETKNGCLTKKEEWESRSETRSLELEAMRTAIKILAKVVGVRTGKPKNKFYISAVDFLEVMHQETGVDLKARAVNLLKKTAIVAHSRALERLAVEVAAHLNGPFSQVDNMIQKMIFRLMAEQKAEDQHKLWCDKELAQTKAMKDSKDDNVEELDSKIKVAKTSVAELVDK
jgi:hypothetical protein